MGSQWSHPDRDALPPACGGEAGFGNPPGENRGFLCRPVVISRLYSTASVVDASSSSRVDIRQPSIGVCGTHRAGLSPFDIYRNALTVAPSLLPLQPDGLARVEILPAQANHGVRDRLVACGAARLRAHHVADDLAELLGECPPGDEMEQATCAL